jgi:hypothetical protein
VPRTSLVYQLELSADSAGKWGVESEGQNAETAEQTAGTAEQGARTAATQSYEILFKGGRCRTDTANQRGGGE